MDTFLSDNDEALKKDFERFAQKKLAPIAFALADRKQSLIGFFEQMAQAGYLALNVPVEYGGKNSPFLHVALLAEALAHYEVGVVVSLAYHAACIELIKEYGSDEQKSLYLPKLASGALLGTVAHIKQQEKMLAVLSEFPLTVPHLVFVCDGGDFFLIDDLEAGKIKIEERPPMMGLRSVYFVDLVEVDCIDPRTRADYIRPYNAISPYNASCTAFARDIIKTILAAAAVGMSQSVLDQTVAYAKVGQRDGQPLSQSEAIQWKLADLAVESNAARLLTYRAAWSKDEDKERFPQYAAMCKAYAARMSRFHSGEGLQVLLPLLNDTESSLSRFYLDGKMLETFEATNEEEKVLLSNLLGIK